MIWYNYYSYKYITGRAGECEGLITLTKLPEALITYNVMSSTTIMLYAHRTITAMLNVNELYITIVCMN